ncbi:NCS1 family nucleobase:cation symporter-1 [Aestuariispira insulae]|uniref:NCS1 family nucleobase:cation symporter-1 n=1 Tax=Aestuariispira insulae TaxID=1461337 RepID=A0A3D9HNB7_9PROT|nr:NCS1 family nucleobase:cation symporter-1 [Aestuariispira insulae]RED50791.1 NCS1 family nucleobase:cation symporter-1 [Aestuariispira insulae]
MTDNASVAGQGTVTDEYGVTHSQIAGADPDLFNEDLAPASAEARTWDWKAIAALWVGMVVCVPTYFIAASLVADGMSWWQAVITVLLGNVIVAVPMMLIGHAGTKHGIPFPVLLRSSFGTVGAKIPGVARGLVACGWFGIQTWVGGSAIYVILNAVSGNAFAGEPLPFLGIDAAQTLSFLAFWALHLWFIRHGTESIRWLETYAAPFLLLMGLALLAWAYVKAGGFGEMLSAPSAFGPGGEKEGQFWSAFIPGLTAMVGFWATLALNIPDFTRYAKSQKDQILGQAVGLPIPMALFAFIGVAVTSATVVIYGEAIWDPVKLAERMEGFGIVVALFALVVATLTTNLAANVVAPSHGFSNLSPKKISFKMGGYITAAIGIAIFPWKLIESTQGYIFTWLIGYSALLGPIAGILIVDYFLIRKTELKVDDLFRHDGIYGGRNGWNMAGITALIIGILPNLPGFLNAAGFVESVPSFFTGIYDFAWFVGLLIAGIVYFAMMSGKRS